MIEFESTGDFKKTEGFLNKLREIFGYSVLEKYGKKGVEALSIATPKDTGLTASSWSYNVKKTDRGVELNFTNSNVNNGVNIALILQMGHGTKNGGWVEGRDYINPAIQPIFDSILSDAMEEISRL